ncbi:MAG TPA: TM0106 family RecB-like putative nuclease, partial [Stellaceae bacterium]|nr:TM0106 family RecB-like putative nuclease [Stellaceae bacterium]
MQLSAGGLLLSASDLVNFLGCAHTSYLDLRQLTEPVAVSGPDEVTALLMEKGIAHERAYLDTLKASRRAVVEIKGEGLTLMDRVALTRNAMQSGAAVIYQGALATARWSGYADFLVRVEEESKLGPWSYEAIDTKLARHAKPEHVVQLATYTRLIGIEQGRMPAQLHVLLGDNKRVSLRVADFIHYHAIAQTRLEAFTTSPPVCSTAEPCGHCAQCRWIDRCQEEWEGADHLSLVANITRHQRTRLCSAGVSTVRSLAALPEGAKIPHLQPETVSRLQRQAALQVAKRETGEDRVELLPAVAAKGFARLPPPDPGDIFFDMEGNPASEGGSLEYLFGFITVEAGQPRFIPFWAHDRQAERRAFEQAMDFIGARLEHHPDAFIYHYASYEESALKRLAMVHGTRETQLDDLLRRRKLVDLYKVVREAIRISEPRYSIKNLEVFYGAGRAGEVTTALDSVVFYERWLQSGEPSLLDKIAAYNEEDCRSLLLCRDWLLSLRPAGIPWFDAGPLTEEDTRNPDPEKAAKRRETEERSAELARRLVEGVPEAELPWRELAGQLIDFHRREAKPVWWAMFNRQDMADEELIDDAECIGGLRTDPDCSPFSERQSIVHPYRFPAQDFKLRLGDRPLIANTLAPAGEIVRLNEDACEISLKISKKRGPLPASLSLIPAGPVEDKMLRAAIARYAEAVADEHQDRYAAITAILRRDYPRFTGPAAVGENADDVTRAIDAIGRLYDSHILIQGPPGAGKTYCAAQAIIELLARGNRVGVSSHSHKAINTLLAEIETAAAKRGFR